MSQTKKFNKLKTVLWKYKYEVHSISMYLYTELTATTKCLVENFAVKKLI